MPFRDHLMFVCSFYFNNIHMLNYSPTPRFQKYSSKRHKRPFRNLPNGQNLKLHLIYYHLPLFYLVSGFF